MPTQSIQPGDGGWPQVIDLNNLLTTFKVAIPAQIDQESALSTAVSLWEETTGYHPFIAADPSQARTFDGNYTNEIGWSGGLVSLDDNGVTINGAIYSSGFYSLKPNNASQLGKPYTSIRFGQYQNGYLPVVNGPTEDGISYLGGAQRVITITGQWGYCLPANIPAAAWNAVLKLAAALCTVPLSISVSKGGLFAMKLADESRSFGASTGAPPMAAQATQWQNDFNNAAMLFKRLSY